MVRPTIIDNALWGGLDLDTTAHVLHGERGSVLPRLELHAGACRPLQVVVDGRSHQLVGLQGEQRAGGDT